MPGNPAIDLLAQQARFVFKGTVRKLKAATMPVIPVTDRTVVVRVDEITHAPEGLSDCVGQEITVQLGGTKRVQKGDEAVFFANGWVFGESIGVLSIDHHAVEGARAALGAAAGSDPVANLANREMRARFESADVVVSGRVANVKLPAERTSLGMAQAVVAGESTTSQPISEHDPLILEAEIEVAAVHKGIHAGKHATIRFPSSTDVKWYKAPKFHAGQEGVFLLHKDEMEKAPEKARKGLMAAGGVAAEIERGAYTALHPSDFQPFDRQGVKELIGSKQP